MVVGNSSRSSRASSVSGGNGQVTPLAAARWRYLQTTPLETPQARATLSLLSLASYLRRSISVI